MAMEWIDEARCKEVGTELFFPEQSDVIGSRRARSICNKCEVKAECLEYGINEEFGIWGGLTSVERRHLRKQRKAIA